MYNRSLKVFLACALGAFVGTLTAMQLANQFWFIGLIVGGLVGYLSFEVERIARAVKQASRELSQWRPNTDYWKHEGFLMVVTLSQLTLSLAVLYVLLRPNNYLEELPLFMTPIVLLMVVGGTFGTVFGLAFLTIVIVSLRGADEVDKEILRSENSDILIRALFLNPIGIMLYPSILFLRNFRSCISTAIRFLYVFYKEIHSDIRLLCGIDAAIGVGIGYWYGNPLIGAVVGGIWGVFNYEIVSKRLLK